LNDATATTTPPPETVETPSGKDAAYENFPVGSWLLPRALRPHIAIFYAYARAIDDIADSPDLTPDEKVRRLDGFESAISGAETTDSAYAKGHRMRESLNATGVTTAHCVDLVRAFKQDAVKLRYDDWDDLMGYCNLSASPVGRYLLDLHGGARDGYASSDALCNALQVINHLQDCQDDYRTLDRVYLPGDWMAEEGARAEDLDAKASTPALRAVFDRTLDGVEALMMTARQLPANLASRRLAMEAAAIVRIADKLAALLRRRDPLAARVELTRPQFIACCTRGAISALL
jgi:squalene synthase HpnC